MALTGNKLRDKEYIRHTGYPGGIRVRTARESLARDPTSLLRMAVLRMLPRNLLRHARARKLRLFPHEQHPGFDPRTLVPLHPLPRAVRVKDEMQLPDDFDSVLPEGVFAANPAAVAADAARRAAAREQRLAREARLAEARARATT